MAATGQMTQAPSTPSVPSLPIAGLGLRIVAFILDGIVVFGLVMLFFALGFLQAAVQGDDPPDWSIWLGLGVTLSAIFPVAPILFFVLWAWRSQSLGQMAVGLIVTTRQGYRLSIGRAFLRAVLWPLSLIPLGAGMYPILFDHERRALHDYIAGTVVRELR
jgi:uncharacterized RDD family membrane protein YckC